MKEGREGMPKRKFYKKTLPSGRVIVCSMPKRNRQATQATTIKTKPKKKTPRDQLGRFLEKGL